MILFISESTDIQMENTVVYGGLPVYSGDTEPQSACSTASMTPDQCSGGPLSVTSHSTVAHAQSPVAPCTTSEAQLGSDSEALSTPPIEMLGDNIDVTITPSKMTSESQRKSLHWFLVMMKQKRVTANDIDMSKVLLMIHLYIWVFVYT